MTDSLIERMARAIMVEHHSSKPLRPAEFAGVPSYYGDMARAALAAARVPTEHMCETGNRTAYKLITDPGVGEAVWQAMIDEALKD